MQIAELSCWQRSDPDHGGAGRNAACPGGRAGRALLTLVFLSALTQSPSAGAQVPGVGGGLDQRQPAEQLRELPLPQELSQPEPELLVPERPAAQDPDALSSQLTVPIAGVQLRGSTRLTREDVEAVTAPYLQRGRVSSAELEDIRLALTRLYIERGYRTSGVLLPDQTPAANDNVIVYRAVEGALGAVRVQGVERLRPWYVANRLWVDAQTPLDVNALRDRVQLLLDDPSIAGVRARLGPGDRLGEAELIVDVEEAGPFSVDFTLDNRRSPSVGEVQLGTHATLRNVAGFGERVSYRLQRTDGFRGHELEVGAPINARDTWLVGRYYTSESRVVEAPFDSINIESESKDVKIEIHHPVYRRPGRELLLGLSFETRRSQTALLGQPFSFSPGVQRGLSRVSPLRAWQSWLDRGRDHVFALRSVFSFGLNVFDATINPAPLPDGRYFAWLGQVQYVRRLGSTDMQLHLRANAQLTRDSLLPLEKFTVGGANSVRGYRENQLVRDNGLDASVELRIPVFRLPIPGLSKTSTDGQVEIAPFFDYGRAWSAKGSTPAPKHIYSIGAGVRYRAAAHAEASVYVGHPLRRVPSPDDKSVQDYGVHFQMRVGYD